MRLLICAGGTGGGVYPALTVLQALKRTYEDRLPRSGQPKELAVLWIGGIGGMEAELISRAGLPFKAIPAAGVHGVGWRALPGNLWRLSKGYLAARRIVRSFCPDVMLFTGGYLAVPMALASQRLFGYRSPSLLFVPDIEPGLALKTLARFASRIALTTDDSRLYFPKKNNLSVTGYPVREDLLRWTRQEAFQAFNLEEGLPVLLVVGGSTGAKSINQALAGELANLLKRMQIIHISGQRNWEDVQMTAAGLPADLGKRYHPFPYLHAEMGAALSAADLVLSRAGASCLGDYPMFGLPAILVPYPYAWRYQQINAEYLARRGAAILLADRDLSTQLAGRICELFDQPARLVEMRSAMHSLAQPAAAERIAGIIEALAEKDRSG